MEVRFFLSRDLPQAMDIERRSYGQAWTEKEFKAFAKDERAVGKVVVEDTRVIAYCFYLLKPDSIDLYNIAVHPEERRRGVARLLMTSTFTKFNKKRKKLNCLVPERNLAAQLFFKAMGMKAVKVIKNAWEGSDMDGYLFEVTEDELEKTDEDLLARDAG